MMFASARMDAGQSNIVSRKQYMSCCLLGCLSKRCLIVLAFVLDMNISYDIIFLFYCGVLANDVC